MSSTNSVTKKVPATLKIGPFNYDIVLDAAQHNAFRVKDGQDLDSIGNTDTAGQKIYIQSDLPYEVLSETLLHEIMHAIYYNSAIEHMKEPSEEVIVSLISIGLFSVLKENPKLVEYLFGTN